MTKAISDLETAEQSVPTETTGSDSPSAIILRNYRCESLSTLISKRGLWDRSEVTIGYPITNKTIESEK